MSERAEATPLAHKQDRQVLSVPLNQKESREMTNILMFLVGFAVGVVLARLFEQRTVNEVEKLRAFVTLELQKIAAKL